MKSTRFGDVPNSWGDTELTLFIDHTRENQLLTFVHCRNVVQAIEAIDQLLHEIAKNVSNIVGQFSAPLFVLRCHSAFRAAAGMALSGQAAETFVMIRSVLEYAGYGLLIAKNPQLESLWMSRHSDAKAPRIIASAFSSKNIRAEIEKHNVDDARIFDEFYQRAIDFGAHPNSHGVNASLSVSQTETELVMFSKYLHDIDQPHRHALRSMAQAGVCAVRIFHMAFPARLDELRVPSRLASITSNWPL